MTTLFKQPVPMDWVVGPPLPDGTRLLGQVEDVSEDAIAVSWCCLSSNDARPRESFSRSRFLHREGTWWELLGVSLTVPWRIF